MLKKITIIFILIVIFISPYTQATDEIISAQMDALNLSSFIKEGENYTKNILPDLNLNELLNSAISGQIDNSSIFKGVLSVFGKEISSSILLLAVIIAVIVIHSILKSFTDNLNNGQGVGQIAYYVEYILIVTLIMSNFSGIINMIKESVSNLVGFVNSLVPILIALMAASRECSICCFGTAIDIICSCFYRKHYNHSYFTSYISCNSNRNNI